MKVLKVALCLIFAAILTVHPPAQTARADDGKKYAIALTATVYLCEERDENSDLFAIPYSYYVEILREYDEWYQIRYARSDGLYEPVQGYCKKDNLMVVDEPAENVYLYYPLEVTLSSATGAGGTLPDLEMTVTAAFYGNYYKGAATYSYVLYNGTFGYVEGEISDYTTNEIPSLPTFSETEESKSDNNAKIITALIISAIAVAAVAVLIVTGRRKPIK